MLRRLIKDYLATSGSNRRNNVRLILLRITLIAGLLSPAVISVASSSQTDPLVNLPPSLDGSMPNSALPEYVIIKPNDEVTFSSETSASVATISIKEGSTFQKDDVLLTLDCRVQDAEYKKAKAQQDLNALAYKSAQKLKSFGSISELEHMQAESEMKMADADVEKLGAIVEKCVIKAPFNGAVADLMVHVHESVKPGDPLLKIVSTDDLDFEVQVPSLWLSWLQLDSTFSVHVNETNKNVIVKVAKIAPEIDSVSQTVKVIGKLVEPDPTLLPGMSGQATFTDDPNKKIKSTTVKK